MQVSDTKQCAIIIVADAKAEMAYPSRQGIKSKVESTTEAPVANQLQTQTQFAHEYALHIS